MKATTPIYFSAVLRPKDLVEHFLPEHLSLRTQVLSSSMKVGSQTGIPNPSSPEELLQKSLGVDHTKEPQLLKPKLRKSVDPFFSRIPDSLVDFNKLQDINQVVRYYMSPLEVGKEIHKRQVDQQVEKQLLLRKFNFTLK
jgi:hypothetical protein